MFTRFFFICLVFLVAACSTTQKEQLRIGLVPKNIENLLVDRYFLTNELADIKVEEVDIYKLPKGVVSYLEQEIVPLPSEEQRYRALRKWIFDYADNYDYDPNTTVPISKIDEIGKINCLSFSTLFVAAARHVGIPADIQLIYSPPAWEMTGQSWLLAQHINVTGKIRRALGPREVNARLNLPTDTGTFIKRTSERYEIQKYVVDLNPRVVVNAYRTELLQDDEVASRYHANIGAEALVNDNYSAAYLHMKQAITLNNMSSPAWNNLGVLYSRVNQPELARQSYLTALQVDPDADSALTNLTALHQRLGNEDRATELKTRIATRIEKNPFYHFYLGKDLLEIGEYDKAIARFESAIHRKKDEQLFYLFLAEAQLAQNQIRKAEKSLKQAEKYAEPANQKQYAHLTQQLIQEKNHQ